MSPITIARKAEAATAVGLPLSWYSDPEILEIEQGELFDAGPSYAGHQCLVPKEGDFAVRGGPQAGRVLVRHQGEAQPLAHVQTREVRLARVQSLTARGFARAACARGRRC